MNSFHFPFTTKENGKYEIDGNGKTEDAKHHRFRKRNLIKSVVFSALLNAFGPTPYAVWYTLQNASVLTVQQLNVYYQISIFIRNAWSAMDFFVYYLFNKRFKNVLKGYLKKTRLIKKNVN